MKEVIGCLLFCLCVVSVDALGGACYAPVMCETSGHSTKHWMRINSQDGEAGCICDCKERQELCDFEYNGKCYWVAMASGGTISVVPHENMCSPLGGLPAIIVDQQHFQKVMEVARSKLPADQRFADLYTGMKVNPSTGHVYASHGSQVPFVRWRRGAPNRGATNNVRVMIAVLHPLDDIYNDMFNSADTYGVQAAVCEK